MNAMRWCPRRRSGEPRGIAAWVLAALMALGTVSGARADIPEEGAVHVTPPRLGVVDGEVLFWRPGAGDWESAQLNLPLAAGDALATREGKLELQIGAKSFVRAGDGTQMRLQSLEPDFIQFEISSGHVTADVRGLPRGDTIALAAPSGTVRISRDGYYRVDVDGDTTRVFVRRGGEAEVRPSGGSPAEVTTGDGVELVGRSDASVTALAAPPFDEWDRWNYDRAGQYFSARRSYAVSEDVYGGPELEQNGSWRDVNTYGRVWVPYTVPVGWAPYTYGRWITDPLYGWSWVDYAPWGWAPYHYGRWVYCGYWAWAPGPVLAAPVYSPALVAFFGGPAFSVGIGIGAPLVSWVPLGWGEPLVPWWGSVGFIGRPCWHGWGGPRIVNNIVINNGDVVNAGSIKVFRNATVPGGLTTVSRDQFTAGNLERIRVNVRGGDLTPVHGALPVVARSGGGAANAAIPALGAAHPAGATARAFDAADAARSARAAIDRPMSEPRNLQRGGAPAPSVSRGMPSASSAAFDAVRARAHSATTTTIEGSGRRVYVMRGQPSTNDAAGRPTVSESLGHVRTQPPPLGQASQGALPQVRRSNPTVVTTAPPLPRSVSRGATMPSGGTIGRPSVPSASQFRAPSYAAQTGAMPSGNVHSVTRGGGGAPTSGGAARGVSPSGAMGNAGHTMSAGGAGAAVGRGGR